MVIGRSAEDGLVERLEFGEDASLMSEDGNPGVFPGLGRFDYLTDVSLLGIVLPASWAIPL